MELKENTILKNGEYRIINTLGQGGFGITYLAQQTKLRRNVVVKEFFIKNNCERDNATRRVSLGTSGSREMIERFLQKFLKEASLIAALNHPNIVRVIDIFEENNTAYYAMEYHPNGSLGSIIDREGAKSEPTALRYIRQIASALDYIHSHKMMHLDVKPDNILINNWGKAVLIDFGLSKRYNNDGKASSTTPVGISHGYAPLEQYDDGCANTFAPTMDIYALGATLYTLLTGEVPPPASIIFSYGLPELPETVSGTTRLAIERAMSPKPTDRPQSIGQFLSLLDVPGRPRATEPMKKASRATEPMINRGGAARPEQPISSGNVPKPERHSPHQKKPFNWNIPAGIIAAILCMVFAGAGINRCNGNSVGQQLPATVNVEQETNDYTATAEKKATQQRNSYSAANLSGELYVTTTPTGAAVTVNGKRIGTTPIEAYKLNEGSYTVKIAKEGYITYTKSITISDAPVIINEALTTKPTEQKAASKPSAVDAAKYYNDGVKAYNAKNYTEAARLYRIAAEQGHADAQNNLGYCNEKQLGVAKDLTEAVKWYRKAAEQGQADAQCNLAYCYETATGVAKDFTEAAKWYRKAAERGYARAQYYLGCCYEKGLGVVKNHSEATYWYRKAAEQGHVQAQHNLGYCYEKGLGVARNPSEAVKWYRKAAEQGQADAQCNLGYCYEKGLGVEKDPKEAAKWYRKAAEQGQADAQCNLGYCYEKGLGVEKDPKEAVKWYRKSAEQGFARAQCNLGLCYEYKKGVQKDLAEAVKWYREAAEQGQVNAQYNLAHCYEHKKGVRKDLTEAVKWYRKAAEQGHADAKAALKRLNK